MANILLQAVEKPRQQGKILQFVAAPSFIKERPPLREIKYTVKGLEHFSDACKEIPLRILNDSSQSLYLLIEKAAFSKFGIFDDGVGLSVGKVLGILAFEHIENFWGVRYELRGIVGGDALGFFERGFQSGHSNKLYFKPWVLKAE